MKMKMETALIQKRVSTRTLKKKKIRLKNRLRFAQFDMRAICLMDFFGVQLQLLRLYMYLSFK